MKTIDEEIKINDQLNPALWDNNELKEDVKEKLLDIVDNFLDGLKEDKINIDVVDVRLLGSNANYNYTDKSDIDLHIVADFSSTPCEQNVMPQLYNAYRSLFSKAYDIKVNGYDVELYVEDVNQPAKSNGVYSLYTGWVSEPKRSEIPEINWEQFELVFDGMEDRYFDVVGEHSDGHLGSNVNEDYANNIDKDILDTIKNPLDKLYKNTKCSKSAGTMLDYYFYETDKPLKLCLGAIRHKGDESKAKDITHVWIELDGKVRETNFPDGDYERVLVDELLIDRNEDLYNQVENFLNKPSLREALSQEVDSEGNPLTKEQVEFFKNSKVRDSRGRLLVCYHGSDADRFNVFDHSFISDDNKSGFGFYFTLGTKLKFKYTSEYACYINLTNPLTDIETIGKYVRDGEDLRSKGFTQKEIIDKLSKKYKCDGIINQERGVIAFEPNQIKSITNKTPSNSDNINEDWLSDANKIETIKQELNQAYDDLMGNDKTRLYRYREWANNSNNDYKEYIYNDLKKNKDKSLRLWYNTYRLRSGDYDLSYDDFLRKPFKLYRATNVDEKDSVSNTFFSYALTKQLAQRFLSGVFNLDNGRTGEIEEIEVTPSQTLGMFPSDEEEIIIPNTTYEKDNQSILDRVNKLIDYANDNNVELPYDQDELIDIFKKEGRDKDNLEQQVIAYVDKRKGLKEDKLQERKAIDLTGQQFGELTVIGRDTSKKGKESYWLCKCSCGNETSVARKHLINGDIKSCGHLRSQNGKDHADNFNGMRDRQDKYHTNLEVIRNQTMQPNNTSGVKGVDYHKTRNMWRARVFLNGKEVTKWFKDFDDAVAWRKNAEKQYYDPQVDKATKNGDLKEDLNNNSFSGIVYRGEKTNGKRGLALYGYGKYFTSDKKSAGYYGNVKTYKITIKNPLTFDGREYNTLDSYVIHHFEDMVKKYDPDYFTEFRIIEELNDGVSTKIVKELGYDGLIITFPIKETYYVLFTNNYELVNDNINEALNNYGYHAGDLGKSEGRERQTGGRGTGHFGTGTYFVGDPEKIKTYNDNQYGKGKAPHHIVDFSSYNLYKPSNDDFGFKLHRALSELNNGYKYYTKYGKDLDYFINRNLTARRSGEFECKDIPEIVSHLNNLLWDYEQIELPTDIDWNTIDDEYEKYDDIIYDELKPQYTDENGNVEYGKLFDAVEEKIEEKPIFKERARVVKDVREAIESEITENIVDNYKNSKNLIDHLFIALEGRHSKGEIGIALKEVNKHLDDKTGDSLSTIFMKDLGYDGVDTRGLSGLDNTTYGSVIYDLKPETIVEGAIDKK